MVNNAEMVDDLRAAATILERINAAYGYPIAHGSWSPLDLVREAQYLADHLK